MLGNFPFFVQRGKPVEGMEKLRELGVGTRTPDDPFFDRGNALCRRDIPRGIVDIDEEELCHRMVGEFRCHVLNCSQEFESLLAFEMHYNSCHRFSCCECRKQLPSPHLLDLHISETHDSFFLVQAERKPMYRCYVETCNVVSSDPTSRRSHCIEEHQFPHDFKFDSREKKGGKSKNRAKKTEEASKSSEKSNSPSKKPAPKGVRHQFALKTFSEPHDTSFLVQAERKPMEASTSSEKPNSPTKTPAPKGPLTFGRRVGLKTFSTKKNSKPRDIDMNELMESLPS